MRQWLSAQGYLIAWRVVRIMPEPLAYLIFQWMADQSWRRSGTGVRQLERNLRRIVPKASEQELRSLSKRSMRLYLRYWCDSFRIPDWSQERIVKSIRVINEENLRSALAGGKGCVVATAHVGNWDHAGAWACLTGMPLTTVAERLKPESLFQAFLRYRQALGMEVLPTDGNHIVGVLASRLRQGRLVALVADRDLSNNGVPIQFFGETVSLPTGPAALAVQTGAPLIPAFVRYLEPRDPKGFNIEIEFFPPLMDSDMNTKAERVASMIASCAQIYEREIAKDPTQWHMLARFWTKDRNSTPE